MADPIKEPLKVEHRVGEAVQPDDTAKLPDLVFDFDVNDLGGDQTDTANARVTRSARPNAGSERPTRVDVIALQEYQALAALLEKAFFTESVEPATDIKNINFKAKLKLLGDTFLKDKGHQSPADHEAARQQAKALLTEHLAAARIVYETAQSTFATRKNRFGQSIVRVRGRKTQTFEQMMEIWTESLGRLQQQAYELVTRWAVGRVEDAENELDNLTRRTNLDQTLQDNLKALNGETVTALDQASYQDLAMLRSQLLVDFPHEITTEPDRYQKAITAAAGRVEEAVAGSLIFHTAVVAGSTEESKTIRINNQKDLEAIPDINTYLEQARGLVAKSDATVPTLDQATYFQKRDWLIKWIRTQGSSRPGNPNLRVYKGTGGASWDCYPGDIAAKKNRLNSYTEARSRWIEGKKINLNEIGFLEAKVCSVCGNGIADVVNTLTVGKAIDHIANMYRWFLEMADDAIPEDDMAGQKGEKEQEGVYLSRMSQLAADRRRAVAQELGYATMVDGKPKVVLGRLRTLVNQAVLEAPFVGQLRDNMRQLRKFGGPALADSFKGAVKDLSFHERAEISEELREALYRHVKQLVKKNEAYKVLLGSHKTKADALAAKTNVKDRRALAQQFDAVVLTDLELGTATAFNNARLQLMIDKIRARDKDIFSSKPINPEANMDTLHAELMEQSVALPAVGSTGEVTLGAAAQAALEQARASAAEFVSDERLAPLRQQLDGLFSEDDKPIFTALQHSIDENRPKTAADYEAFYRRVIQFCDRLRILSSHNNDIVWCDAAGFTRLKEGTEDEFMIDHKAIKNFVQRIRHAQQLIETGNVFRIADDYAHELIPVAARQNIQDNFARLQTPGLLEAIVARLVHCPAVEQADFDITRTLNNIQLVLNTSNQKGDKLLISLNLGNTDHWNNQSILDLITTATANAPVDPRTL